MKRSRLKPISPKRDERADAAKEFYEDCHGVRFHEVRGVWVPERVSDWPSVRYVTSTDVLDDFYSMNSEDPCWYGCGHYRGFDGSFEIHHIMTRGRSDEQTNLFWICRKCHTEIQSQRDLLGRVLYLKWTHDREHTNWQRLTLLHGRHLPELEVA